MEEPASLAASFREWLTDGREWMEHAACREIDLPPQERVELFFPTKGGRTDPVRVVHRRGRSVMMTRTALAKAFCRVCPVSAECKDYADRTNEMYGIWNGETRKRYPKASDDPFL